MNSKPSGSAGASPSQKLTECESTTGGRGSSRAEGLGARGSAGASPSR